MAKKQAPTKRKAVTDGISGLLDPPPPTRKTAGRPPAGTSGVKVSGYPHQVSARIQGEPFHLLEAAAHVLRRPHWQILTAAIAAHIDTMKDDRDEIRRLAKAAQTRCDKCNPK